MVTLTVCLTQFSVFMPGAGFDSNYFWELKGASCLVWQILVAMYSCLRHLLCLKVTITEEVLANDLRKKKHIWNSLHSCPKRNSDNSDIFSLYNHMLSCSAYTDVPGVSPADLLSPANVFWWAASAPQVVEGWPGEHRASSWSIPFRPHKVTQLQSNWSGLGLCPTQKKSFRADTVTRVLLLSLALQMGHAQRAVCPQGSITVPVHRACHLLCLAN